MTRALAAAGAALALAAAAAASPAPAVDRFDAARAWRWAALQVGMGPRPAGSPALRRLAERLRSALPHGRFQELPGGLRNVWGVVRGRDRSRVVVVGAHYDTKDLPGFVGAIDGASGTAVVMELARIVKPGALGPTVVFVLFDGEESPAGAPDSDFVHEGIRGSRAFAPGFRTAEAMILLDFVGNKQLVLRREGLSDARLWAKLRAAAARAGVGSVFPAATQGGVLDDHYPFLQEGVPSIDLIDFDFACWHRTCDDLSQVSPESLDATGEAVYELLRSL